MQLDLRLSRYRNWSQAEEGDSRVATCGWAEVGGTVLSGKELAAAVAGAGVSANKELWPGEFAAVVHDRNEVRLVCDSIRSIPLVFQFEGERLAVSDELDLLVPGAVNLEPDSCAEFLAAGFVTGSHTLFSGIEAVQAGETVLVQGGKAERTDWYRYACDYRSSVEESLLIQAHDEAVFAAFERMLESVKGRQLVLPLSGGLDSRLVAATLKRLGRDNVLCFTYGHPGGKEDGPSRSVAETLGYERVLVPYDADLLRRELRSKEALAFRRFAGGGVSSPHLDDWTAVKLLKQGGHLEPDAVFVPGHTGDFICGGHLKHIFDPAHNADPYAFAPAMLTKHYGLFENHMSRPEVDAVLRSRLENVLAGMSLDTFEGLAAAYELWEWRERQAKFIVNSVRSYEWHGFEFRVPLWDRALMNFWKSVPLGMKHEKYLYRAALEATDETGVFQGVALSEPWDREGAVGKAGKRASNPRRRMKNWLLGLPCIREVRLGKARRRKLEKDYDDHPVGLARLWDRDEYVTEKPDKRHSQALLTLEYLEMVGAKGL